MSSALFSPITLRDLTLNNRIVVSPMGQYHSSEGSAGDWHLMHLGSLSMGAAGLLMVEMTNVTMDGRISTRCATLCTDENERSEEHKSELQSLMRISYAVFCLKKIKTAYNRRYDKL